MNARSRSRMLAAVAVVTKGVIVLGAVYGWWISQHC